MIVLTAGALFIASLTLTAVSLLINLEKPRRGAPNSVF